MSRIDKPPFWELERGGGHHTDWIRRHEESAKKQAKQDRARRNPLTLFDGGGRVRKDLASDGRTREERRKLGLCRECGMEPLEGLTMCAKHHERMLQYRAARRAASGGE